MENKQLLNWGILGGGAMAREFCETLSVVSNLYAISSRTKESRKYFEDKYNVQKTYEKYEEMVQDPMVDIVYVVTVNSMHYDHIKLALETGKHVLCEKAIWHNYEDILELRKIANDNKVVLAEAMTLYHMPLIKEIRRQVGAGHIGNVKYVKADLGSLKDDSVNNRFFSKDVGGGAMLDIGTYTISLMNLFLSDKIMNIHAFSTSHDTGVDESWSISLLDNNGVLGTSNIGLKGKLPKTAIISGDEGYYFIDNYVRADTAKLIRPDGTEEILSVGDSEKAVEYEILDFEDAILNNSDSSFIEETTQVVKIMDTLLSDRNKNNEK